MGEAAGGTEWGKRKERQRNRKGHEEEDSRIRGPRRNNECNHRLRKADSKGKTKGGR